jgi:hypothetical protein
MSNLLRRRMWWIIAVALFWPLIGEITANFIVWLRVGNDDFIFPSMDLLRRLIPAGIVSGFFLGWLIFYLLDRVRTTTVRILTVLSCLFSVTISDRATLMAGFVAVWWYLPFRISYFVNEVLTLILMICCGFTAGAILILVGFGLAKALNLALKWTGRAGVFRSRRAG